MPSKSFDGHCKVWFSTSAKHDSGWLVVAFLFALQSQMDCNTKSWHFDMAVFKFNTVSVDPKYIEKFRPTSKNLNSSLF